MAALIAWKNLADQAVLSVETGTVDTNFPLSNAQVRGLAAEVYSVPGGPGTPLRLIADMTATPFEWLDPSFESALGGIVETIAVQADGKILIGGQFTSIAGQPRNRIARLNADGTLDTTFNPNANNTVNSIAVQADGKILVGGSFTTIGGVARNRIARLNADGTADTSFNPNANNRVTTIVLQADGKILAGGVFTNIGGQSRSCIARLNADGTADTSFNPNSNGEVVAIAIQPNGLILVGGVFTTIGGTTRNRIARLNANGTLDTGFNPNVNGTVYALAVQPDNLRILVGGTFTTVGGTSRTNIARLLISGSVDTSFNAAPDAGVTTIAVQAGGLILAGGVFTSIGGTSARRFAVLHPDGALDGRFILTMNHSVKTIALDTAGRALIGGWFTAPAPYMLRILTESPDQVRMVAVLGMWHEYKGAAVISYRAAVGGTWTEVGSVNAAVVQARVAYLPAHLVVHLTQPVSASGQIRVEFPDSDTTPVRFGRLWISDALVLPDGIDAGWQMGFRDSGSLDATDGQQWVQSPGVITRVLTIPLEGERDTETHWGFADGSEAITNRMSLHALQMEAGTTGEVIAVARTSTDLWTQRTTVYGHIEQPWAIGHTAGPYWGGSLTVVEER